MGAYRKRHGKDGFSPFVRPSRQCHLNDRIPQSRLQLLRDLCFSQFHRQAIDIGPSIVGPECDVSIRFDEIVTVDRLIRKCIKCMDLEKIEGADVGELLDSHHVVIRLGGKGLLPRCGR